MGEKNNNLELINVRSKYEDSAACVEHEKKMKENKKRMKKDKAKKGKNQDYVASNNQSIPAKMQQDCYSTSSESMVSPNTPLRIEPISWRSPSTCSKAPNPSHSVCNPTKKEMECRNKKGKNVVVASDNDDEPSMATEQQHDFSYSSEMMGLPDPRLMIEPSTWRLWPICYKTPAPLRNWDQLSIKNRMPRMNNNMVQEQQIKKRQLMATKTKEELPHQKDERKKKKTKTGKKTLPPVPGVLPNNLKLAIKKHGGSETTLKWLAEKELTISDTTEQQGRLLFPPCGDVLEEYLTDEEKEKLRSKKDEKEKLIKSTDDSNGLKVMVVDTSGKKFDVDLRYWGSVKKFVFIGKWNKMVESLGMIAESDTIQLWFFRLPEDRGSKLCFATNIERGHDNAEEDLLKLRL